MDAFIAGIGQRYLERKANDVPQQLENLAKKKFSSATDTEKQAQQASTLPPEEKDQEIARLRKQLAETKLHDSKATGEAKASKSEKSRAISEAKSPKLEKNKLSKISASETRHAGGSAKEVARLKKGLIPLSIDADAASKDKKGSETRRGRRSSASTATAAKEHKFSSAMGGKYPSRPGNENSEIHDLAALGATEALPHKSKSHKAASAAQASEHGGSAKSTSSTLHAASGRRRSTSHASEIASLAGSTSAVLAPRPPPPPPMHHAPPPRREAVYTEEARHYEVEEPGLYVVEVEEEPPRRRKSMRGRGGGDPGVVEVLSNGGRTVYRVA